MSFYEIGRKIGISEGAVRWHYKNAMAKIKEKLKVLNYE